MDNLAQQLTRSLASDDFDDVLARLPDLQASVEEQLAAAPDDRAREAILTDALALNRRWTSLAQSMRANLHHRLRSLEAESRYADAAESLHIVETVA